MILDELMEFADGLTLATATGTHTEGDNIDLGAARDIGNGSMLYLVIQVVAAVTSGGSATVEFLLASDGSSTIATDGSASEHISTGAIAKADLIAGYTRVLPLPPGNGVAYERYLGLQTKVGTAALTAGSVNAFIVNDVASWKAYADAQN
jgi:hypothetical protein